MRELGFGLNIGRFCFSPAPLGGGSWRIKETGARLRFTPLWAALLSCPSASIPGVGSGCARLSETHCGGRARAPPRHGQILHHLLLLPG